MSVTTPHLPYQQEEKELDSNPDGFDSPEGRQKNRRVEIIIKKDR